MNNVMKSTGFAKWLWQNKVSILVVQVIACAASIIFSLPYFITPEFSSFAVVYPYNVTSYSRENATEQVLQFLNSVDIKDTVIKDFNMYKHYHIDTTKKYWYTELHDEYDRNVEISSTEYEAIKIEVYDRNPDTACLLVKAIINTLNRKILAIQKEKSEESVNLYKKQLDMKKRQMDSLASLSRQLSVQYGLLDYGNQTREVTRAYYQMLSAGKGGKSMDDASTLIKNLEEKGEQFTEVNAHLNSAISDYDGILVKYEDALKDVTKQITYTNVVETPFPADKKTYPVRWLIVFITCLSAFVLSALVLRFIEIAKE